MTSSENTVAVAQRPPIPAHVPPELVFDLTLHRTPSTGDDPFKVSEGMGQTYPPVFFSTERIPAMYDGIWVVTRYEDVREVYQNTELYSTAGVATHQTLVGETFPSIPLSIDPPDHGKYRMLLNPWFAPRAITALEDSIGATVNGLIDGFIDKGACDVAYDFGRLYPVRVFLALMGFPQDKLEDFLAWEYALLHSRPDVEKMRWGVAGAVGFLRQFVEEVRARPNDKLGSYIVHGAIEGRPLTEDEIMGTLFFLWVGGLDTVAATHALMFRRLAMDHEMQATLRAKPEMIPEAIEEFLRTQPIVNSFRVVKKDHEVRGVAIKKGDRILAYNLAGNFDPAEFEEPRTVRLDRQFNRHFTLGGGPHRCLGSHLARRELRIALREFLRRVPEFRLQDGADVTAYPSLLAAAHVPIVW